MMTRILSRGRVYPCFARAVNQNVSRDPVWCRWLPGIAFALIACTTTACLPMEAAGPLQTSPQLIGTWYSLATTRLIADGDASTLIDRDLARIRKLGFNALLLEHYTSGDVRKLADKARAQGLTLIPVDPVAQRYVRTGDPHQPRFADDRLVPSHDAVDARHLGSVVDEPTLARATELARAAKELGHPWGCSITLATDTLRLPDDQPFTSVIATRADAGEADDADHTGHAVAIDCRRGYRDPEVNVRHWLRQFHLGLLAGQGSGVVFDTYRTLPGRAYGIVTEQQPPSPPRLAMLRTISARCRRWSPLLRGLAPTTVELTDPGLSEVRAAAFTSEHATYLLFVNASAERFVRHEAAVACPIAGRVVDRAVTVAKAEDSLVGPVHAVRGQTLRIPLDLAPGEAALFNLF